MVGQLSPDGAWYWDGAAWRSTFSPDGQWRWDGSAWQPALGMGLGPQWARPYASPVTRASLVQLAFAVLGLGYLTQLTGDLLALAGLKGAGDQIGIADSVQSVGLVIVAAAFIATTVLFCMWIHRVYRNLPALGAVRLQHSPRWAVGWWFIPIGNLWKPYQVLREIWQNVAPTGRGWDLLKIWWGVWLVSNYFDNLVTRLGIQGSASDAIDIVSTFLDMGAAALAVVAVRQITVWQVQRAPAAA